MSVSVSGLTSTLAWTGALGGMFGPPLVEEPEVAWVLTDRPVDVPRVL